MSQCPSPACYCYIDVRSSTPRGMMRSTPNAPTNRVGNAARRAFALVETRLEHGAAVDGLALGHEAHKCHSLRSQLDGERLAARRAVEGEGSWDGAELAKESRDEISAEDARTRCPDIMDDDAHACLQITDTRLPTVSRAPLAMLRAVSARDQGPSFVGGAGGPVPARFLSMPKALDARSRVQMGGEGLSISVASREEGRVEFVEREADKRGHGSIRVDVDCADPEVPVSCRERRRPWHLQERASVHALVQPHGSVHEGSKKDRHHPHTGSPHRRHGWDKQAGTLSEGWVDRHCDRRVTRRTTRKQSLSAEGPKTTTNNERGRKEEGALGGGGGERKNEVTDASIRIQDPRPTPICVVG